MMTTIQDKTQ
jgi:hypothetical protein